MTLSLIPRTNDPPFHGMWLTLARHSRRLELADLAEMVDSTPDVLASLEANETRPTPSLLVALSVALHYPAHYFAQANPPEVIWHHHHDDLEQCECGTYLGRKDTRLPLVCPDCLEPTYGCPCCDADMHTVDRPNNKQGDPQRHFVCDRCDFRATTGEMISLWEKGQLR